MPGLASSEQGGAGYRSGRPALRWWRAGARSLCSSDGRGWSMPVSAPRPIFLARVRRSWASRPLDLARGARLHPAAPSAAASGRPTIALAPSSTSGQIHACARPARVFAARVTAACSRFPAKTLQTVSGTSQRQALGSYDVQSGPYEGNPQRLPSCINQPARSFSSSQRPLLRIVARLLMIKSQA
jgi:hypothetical protein